jgi:hypothetical protein
MIMRALANETDLDLAAECVGEHSAVRQARLGLRG